MKRLCYNAVFMILISLMSSAGVLAEESAPIRKILDNGMVVILEENHRAPVITLQAWVQAGGITEAEFTGSGISHFLEHMLFKGTERRTHGQIGIEVKEAGGHTNAYTSNDKTVYYITFHSDHFDKALDILADAIMNSTLDPEEVERERQVIIKEIQMNRDDPFRYLYHMAHRVAYAVHPYKHPVIGYEEILRGLTRDDLMTYYKRMYVPNNIALVAVGDFDAEEAFPKISAAFADFKRKPIVPMTIPVEPAQQGPRQRIEEFPVQVAQSMMGFHGPNLLSEDLYPMDVLAIALGSGETSRLFRELREKRGIVYTVNAWSYTPRDPGLFWIASSFEPENYEAVKEGIWNEIEKLRTEELSEEELETARAKVLSSHIFSNETVGGQALNLGSDELDAHDLSFDKRYVEAIARVTPEDITRVIEKYFTYDNMVVAALTPIGKAIQPGIQSEKPEKTAENQGIEKLVLPNGMTVLLREDRGAQTVAMRLVALGGARAEDESTTGITSLMSKVMLKGTSTRSAEEIAQAIELRGGNIESFSGYNTYGFTVNMLSRHADIGLDILADIIANPSFSPEEIEREKVAVLANIKRVDDKIFDSAMKLFRKTMFKGHPYSFLAQGDAEVVQALTAEQVRKFYFEGAMASRMLLAVFGDIDKSEMLKSIEQKFGHLPKGAALPDAGFSHPTRLEPIEASKAMEKEQLAILLGFPGVRVNDPRRYTLEVLTAFLNSQGGKLFQTLRDERGLAYSVGAFDILGIDPGAYVFYIVTDPANKEAALDGMHEVIEELRNEGINAEDLARTRVELMGNHAISLQTNAQIAAEASFDELYQLGYNNYKEYDSKIKAVTVEEVRKVIQEIFNLDRRTTVYVGNVGTKAEASVSVGTGDRDVSRLVNAE